MVRDAAAEAEPPQTNTATDLQPLPPNDLGDAWHTLVHDLVQRDAIAALVRQLAMQSQWVAREGDVWTLRVEGESLAGASVRDRLQAALVEAGHAVRLQVEVGPVSDSPSRRNAIAAAQKLKAAEALLMADPFVREMMRDFGAKIVPGSIKAL